MSLPLPETTGILIVAPNASTAFGGEAILPVHYFRVLQNRGYRVTMITHARNRDNLVAALGQDCTSIEFIKDTSWHKAIWRAGRPFPVTIREFVFGALLKVIDDWYQSSIIRRMVREGRADLIHQPTPVSPKLPSSIHGYGVPVIIGPMNGGMNFPTGYSEFESATDRRFISLARTISRVANWIIPGKRKARILLVANRRTHMALPVDHDRVEYLVENGVDLSTFKIADPPAFSKPGQLRLVFIGRLVNWKAVDITLQAIADARHQGIDVSLDILGDGPEHTRLKTLSEDLGLQGKVTFHGFQPQAECVFILRQSDALILNSLYECGGAVVLEAMSQGLPVICSDWGGPADYVDADTGILVAPEPRESFVSRLAEAIVALAQDPKRRMAMGKAGQTRIRTDFDWERKVDQILKLYAEALASHAS